MKQWELLEVNSEEYGAFTLVVIPCSAVPSKGLELEPIGGRQ